MGGMTKAVESGWAKLKIEEVRSREAGPHRLGQGRHRRRQQVPSGQGGSRWKCARSTTPRCATSRSPGSSRSAPAATRPPWNSALGELTVCAREGKGNLLDATIKAVRLRATVGEVSDALEKVWGRYRATSQVVSGVYGAAFGQGQDWQQLKREVDEFAATEGRRPRMMIAKLGQDGHDRGAKVVATALADLGFDIDIGPLFQTPEEAARQAIENDCHAIGVSTLAAGHKTLVPELVKALRDQGAERHRGVRGRCHPGAGLRFLTAGRRGGNLRPWHTDSGQCQAGARSDQIDAGLRVRRGENHCRLSLRERMFFRGAKDDFPGKLSPRCSER